MVAFEKSSYSVPYHLMGQSVRVRETGDDQLVVIHDGADGPVEVARHARTRPGVPSMNNEQFPPQPTGSLNREPQAK